RADDGGCTLQHNGQWIASRRAPKREAERLIDNDQPKLGQPCVLLGCGMGYAILHALNRHPRSVVAVLEGDLALLRAVLDLHDFRQTIGAKRLLFGVPLPGQPLADALAPAVEDIATFGAKTYNHGYTASNRAYGELFAHYGEWAREVSVALQTSIAGAEIHIGNALLNVPHYLRSPSLSSLKGTLAGTPGVLVGAGPSIALNLETLQRYAPNACIHVVSTALKRMLGKKLPIATTNVVDYHHLSERYFSGIPATDAPPLLADATAHPKPLDAYSGVKIVEDSWIYRALFGDSVADHGQLGGTSSNVAHHGLNLLLYLGCNPIIFCGLDQAFSFHITHTPGTVIYDEALASVHRFSSFESQELFIITASEDRTDAGVDMYGNPLITDRQMSVSATTFEDIIARNSQTIFINGSEAGRQLKGAQTMTLAQAFERYAPKPVDLGRLTNAVKSASGSASGNTRGAEHLNAKRGELRALKGLLETALAHLKKSESTLVKQGAHAPGLAPALDAYNAAMSKNGGLYEILSRLASGDRLERRRLMVEASDPSLSKVEMARKQVRAQMAYLSALGAAMDIFDGMLERSIARFQSPASAMAPIPTKAATAAQDHTIIDAYIEIPEAGEMRDAFIGNESYSPLRLALNALLDHPRIRSVIVPWQDSLPLPVTDRRIRVVPPSAMPDSPYRSAAHSIRAWNHTGTLHGLQMSSDVATYGNARAILESLVAPLPGYVLVVPGSMGFLTPEIVGSLLDAASESNYSAGIYVGEGPLGLIPSLWDRESLEEVVANNLPAQLIFYHQSKERFWGKEFAYVPSAVKQCRRGFDLRARRDREFARLVASQMDVQNGHANLGAVAEAGSKNYDAWVGRFPRDLEVEITTRRDLHPAYLPSARDEYDMPLDVIESVAKQCADHRDSLNLTLGGFGDSLKHPRFFDIVDTLRPCVRALNVRTFGTALTAEVFERLAQAGVDAVTVRFGYWGREEYRDLNGADIFDELASRILSIRDGRLAQGRMLPLIVAEVVKGAMGDRTLIEFRDAWWSPVSWPHVASYRTYAGAVAPQQTIDLYPATRSPCLRISEQMLILADGRVPLCSEDASAIAGDVLGQSIADIWRGGKLERVRRSHAEKDDAREHKACGDCKAWCALS
ncbi:MAG: DUF115 domain-containing protein, partial [Planctomycetes bacterium]|nr:DUF115 domain-containing protein [Planctomycetota bacterium]